MDLTELADVKALGTWAAGDTQDDAVLARMITSVSAQVERELCRHVEQTSRTEEFYLRQGEKVVTLVGAPISSVTSVKYGADKDWANETALAETTEWIQDAAGGTVRLMFQTQAAPGWVQVIYTGGMAANVSAFKTAFPDISEAVAQQVFYQFSRRQSPGGTVTVQGGTQNFTGQLKLLDMLTQAIETHRRIFL